MGNFLIKINDWLMILLVIGLAIVGTVELLERQEAQRL